MWRFLGYFVKKYMTKMIYEEITSQIIGCAFDVRRKYGKYMLESFYEQVLEIELKSRGLKVERQVHINIVHKGVVIPNAYVADMIVEDKIVLELKAIKTMGVSEFRQLMTYLTLMDKRLGLLINFGAADFSFGDIKNSGITLNKGLYRIIN